MSLWFRSALLVTAMLLMAGAASAGCTYVSSTTDGTYVTERSVTVVYTLTYNCDGDPYSVTLAQTWYDMDGTGSKQPSGWQQTTSGPSGSSTTWGTGTAPVLVNHSTFDPRQWLAEPDPEY